MDIIKKEWALPTTSNVLRQVGFKFKSIGQKLLQWHKMDFDKQRVEMRVIQEKLNDIMKLPFSPDQYEEQRSLHAKYSQLLSQQEMNWRQRSRAIWLKDGDRNSAFFHRRASNRKSRNTIKGLNDEQGQWQSEPAEVQRLLLSYFQTVFSSKGSDAGALQTVLDVTPTKVTGTMNASLLQPYSDEEIKTTLFQMHPSKSPGPDVVANRLKRLLPEIISPLQSAYFPGRLISYNTLVATEAAHFMHQLRSQGEPTSKIVPTRGIRQGDPLSPYLFILCAEGLSALISNAIQQNVIAGLKMCPQAPTLHHLFFADDSFLFGTATEDECYRFKGILDTYEKASGQKVNYQKSSVVFSKNVDMAEQNRLASILAVERADEHDKYLGLPLRVGRSKTAIFEYIKEKLTKKLINWKAKILSCAG
ncbi:uncharacterized protein LOC112198676 [Rosa chinensis]|uniref:uncharacterized protein LOC112198676 n=1 Tax=Rosa chinensis TaxID=74649 RepID=UPI000D0973C9|nr:uncharacterized protein LOC112198676 [Rosa chinensis]